MTDRNVYQRLRDVRLALTSIVKHGEAPPEDGGGYAYVRWDDVADKVGSVMAENGLVVVPTLGEPTTSGLNTKVHLSLAVVNVDAPDDRTIAEWWGEAEDAGDKGVQKAATSATKYALMKLLQLPGADDTEADVPRRATAAVTQSRPPRTDLPALCVQCARAGNKTSQGKEPRMWPGRYGEQCNGVDATGKYQNHKVRAAQAPHTVPRSPEPGREYMEGDACPFQHDPGRPAKFIVAKGGPHRGLLECSGRLNGEFANHLAPPPAHRETGEEIPF